MNREQARLVPELQSGSTLAFIYESLPGRVVFGRGKCSVAGFELDRLKIGNVLMLSTPGQSEKVREFSRTLEHRVGGVFDCAAMHTPVNVTERALSYAAEIGADGLLAFGGGSTIGLSKAIALRANLPQLIIPTTYSGSEMTPIFGQTREGIKETGRSPLVLPESVIYDPELTLGLPAEVSGPSGVNAIAHAVEAMYAENANPVISCFAEEAIAALGRVLPIVCTDGQDVDARTEALYGSWLAGICLGNVGMALHHKICHTLGGSFDLPHADCHCLMLPYTAAYNQPAAAEAMSRVARALGAENAPMGIYSLVQQVGKFRRLGELGLSEADLDRAADLAVKDAYYNPRPVTRDDVREMLQSAFEGRPPS